MSLSISFHCTIMMFNLIVSPSLPAPEGFPYQLARAVDHPPDPAVRSLGLKPWHKLAKRVKKAKWAKREAMSMQEILEWERVCFLWFLWMGNAIFIVVIIYRFASTSGKHQIIGLKLIVWELWILVIRLVSVWFTLLLYISI